MATVLDHDKEVRKVEASDDQTLRSQPTMSEAITHMSSNMTQKKEEKVPRRQAPRKKLAILKTLKCGFIARHTMVAFPSVVLTDTDRIEAQAGSRHSWERAKSQIMSCPRTVAGGFIEDSQLDRRFIKCLFEFFQVNLRIEL